jgi:hypothetical protein
VQEKVSRFILLSGQPLNEPCVLYGPFVMNTRDQIAQAFDDYQTGTIGFEGALLGEASSSVADRSKLLCQAFRIIYRFYRFLIVYSDNIIRDFD